MTILSDITSTPKLIAGAVIAAAVVGFIAYFLHIKAEADRVPALVEANESLVKQAKVNDEIITGLNKNLFDLRKENEALQGDLDADIQKHPAAYACIIPADGVRLVNSAITGRAK